MKQEQETAKVQDGKSKANNEEKPKRFTNALNELKCKSVYLHHRSHIKRFGYVNQILGD